MTFPEDQIAELKRLAKGVSYAEEGSVPYFLLTKLALPEGCEPSNVDALLCPDVLDGYYSRLFFAQRPSSRKSLNWSTSRRILDRGWEAFSWQLNPGTRRLAEMVLMHLQAFR